MTVGNGFYYEFFDFRLDPENHQLLNNGSPVQLTHKTCQVLGMLVRNSGQTTKKEDIFEQLWPDSFVEDGNLTQHIHILRKTLGRTPDGQPYIETVPKQGYRFTLAPEQIAKIPIDAPAEPADRPVEPDVNYIEDAAASAESNDAGDVSDAEYSDTPDASDVFLGGPDNAEENGSRRIGPLAVTLFLGASLIVVLGMVYYFRPQPQTTGAARARSVAVLPFKRIGEEADNEKLGLGMADAIITQLSKLPQLEVRPTSAIFRHLDEPESDSIALGRQLGVDVVLEGTVQREADRVKVSIQLMQVETGNSLWAESFYEKASDIFVVQDLISRRIVTTLFLRLTPQQESFLSNRGTTDPAAYQSYQLGVYFLNKRTKDDLLRSAGYFQQAAEKDPIYAQAFAGLADSYSMLAYYRHANVDEMKEKAKAAAEKALSLNDSIAEAYIALAMTYVIQKESFEKAQEHLERAVSLAPYNGSAHHRYGWILLTTGKLDDGAREMRLAVEYDPLSPATNRAYCSVLVMQRKFADAVTQCESTLQIDGNTPNSGIALARAYFYNGRRAEAISRLEAQIKTGPGPETTAARGELAYYLAKLDRRPEAEKLYNQLQDEYKKDPTRSFELALIAFALGKKDEAYGYFMQMRQLVDSIPDSRISLLYDPYWDDLKNDPRFGPLF